jgi:hypothetical protein
VKKLAVLSLILFTRAATAQEATSTKDATIVLPACDTPPFDVKSFISLVDVELRAVGVVPRLDSTVPPADAGNARVTVELERCDVASTSVELAVTNPQRGEVLRRRIDLSDVPPDLRARTMAIAVVESLRNAAAPAGESTAASLPVQPPSPPPAGAPAPFPAWGPVVPPQMGDREHSPDHGSDHVNGHFEASAGVLAFPSAHTALIGPAVAYALDVGALRASIGGLVTFGRTDAVNGNADVRWTSAFATVGATSETGSLRPLVESRFYAGYGWATGAPTKTGMDAATAGAFVGVLSLAAGVRGNLAGRWGMLADVEAGYAFRGVTFASDQERVAGLSQIVIGARVGVTFAP